MTLKDRAFSLPGWINPNPIRPMFPYPVRAHARLGLLWTFLFAVCAPCICATPQAILSNIHFRGLGELPGGMTGSVATAVSADGSIVVGYSFDVAGAKAIRWNARDGLVSLGASYNNYNYYGSGISGDGTVIAGNMVGIGTNRSEYAVRWVTDGAALILSGGNNHSYGISSDGLVIVGQSVNLSAHTTQAFRWTGSVGMTVLGDLAGGNVNSRAYGVSADGSVIVGYGSTADGTQAFRWTATGGMVGLGYLPGGSGTSYAQGVSADGSAVVGVSKTADGSWEAFRWTSAGGMVGLSDLPGGQQYSWALGVSADGKIVVGYGGDPNNKVAVAWNLRSGSMYSLQDYLSGQGVDLTGWLLQSANAVSADGHTIVGFGMHNGVMEGYSVSGLEWAVVPEPSTYGFLAGLCMLIAAACVRRHLSKLSRGKF